MTEIVPVTTKRQRKAFVDLPFRLYRDDPNWVPPLKGEALGLITPEKNGWFSHAEAQLYLAERNGAVVGRVSAHVDTLALTMPAAQGFGPGVGQWGLMDAEREDIFVALLAKQLGVRPPGWEAVVVFSIGLLLVLGELFLHPGTMIPGLLGVLMMFGALVWAMVTLERWTAAEDTRVVPVLHDEVPSVNVSPPSAG